MTSTPSFENGIARLVARHATFGQVVLLLAACAFVGWHFVAFSTSVHELARVDAITETLISLSDDVSDLEDGQRGFLITGDDAFLAPYLRAQRQIPDRFALLTQLAGADAPTRDAIQRIAANRDAKVRLCEETIRLRRVGDIDGAVSMVKTGEGRRLTESIHKDIQSAQRHWTAEHDRFENTVGTGQRTVSLGVASLTLMAVALSVWSQRRQRAHIATLAAKEAEQRGILESVDEGVVRHDLTGRIVAANRRAGEILGVPSEALLGRYCVDPDWHCVREDGVPVPTEAHPVMIAMRTARPVRGEILGLGPDEGTRRWLLVNANPVIEGDVLRGAVTSIMDITETRRIQNRIAESERRLSQLVNTVPAMISYWDVTARCQFSNAAMDKWYGREVGSIAGKRVCDIVAEDARSISKPYFERALTGEQVEFHRVDHDCAGEERHAIVHYVPDVHDGVVKGVFALVTDTTELTRKVEERTRELAVARDLAEAANRAKDSFLANASHEMRTPLHAIRAFADLSLKHVDDGPDGGDPKLHRFLGNIEDSAQRLNAFVDDLLSLAKLQAGGAPMTLVEVDLQARAAALAAGLEPLLQAKRLRFDFETPEADATVTADEKMTDQVLTNLFSNAIKFSREGGTIHIGVDAVDLAGAADGATRHGLRLTVRDEGVGIPDDELDTIFNKFEQSSRTRTGAGGTGLGLSICQEIVRLHGGTLTARNVPSGGAAFEVVLPRRPPL